MSRPARVLLIAMSICFGICCFGLIGGLFYTCVSFFFFHHSVEQTLSASISFYKALGALGVLGFLLLLAFFIAAVLDQPRRR